MAHSPVQNQENRQYNFFRLVKKLPPKNHAAVYAAGRQGLIGMRSGYKRPKNNSSVRKFGNVIDRLKFEIFRFNEGIRWGVNRAATIGHGRRNVRIG